MRAVGDRLRLLVEVHRAFEVQLALDDAEAELRDLRGAVRYLLVLVRQICFCFDLS